MGEPTLVRLLEAADIPGAMELVRAASWNQTERDWENVLAMAPEGCYAITVDGRLASTATTVCFGKELAWIGMVLTHPDFRGRGFARVLMEKSLDYVERCGVGYVKLDATDMGRPLYSRLGFRDEQVVERWKRPAGGEFRAAVEAYQPMPELDLAAFGADRSGVLERLGVFERASLPGQGFAMCRPGRVAAYFGPCVARSAEAARRLLEWFLASHSGETAYWDVIPANGQAAALAREYGFEPVRRLIRMGRPGRSGGQPVAHDDSLVFGLAGFEYG